MSILPSLHSLLLPRRRLIAASLCAAALGAPCAALAQESMFGNTGRDPIAQEEAPRQQPGQRPQLVGPQGQQLLPQTAPREANGTERARRSGDRGDLETPLLAEDLDVAEQPFYERFSNYLRQTTGKRVLGTLPFNRVGVLNPKLPDSYLVGSGDQIEIQVWGSINMSYTLVVDGAGRIFLPEVGSVQVQGVRNADLSNVIAAQFRRVFKGFELRAIVSAARSIDILVTGHAQTIGQRSIPSSVSLVGAALGFTRPTEGGSRRYIELRRGGRTQLIDLYCFTSGQCGNLPATLQDGDVLHVPQRAGLAAIAGAVNRPGIYEMAPNEGFRELLGYAGGLSIDSSLGSADLYSFQGGGDKDRAFRSVQLAQLCLGRDAVAGCRAPALADGDFLEVKAVPPMVKGSITVTAAGVDPLRFTYQPGMRLLDVVRQPLTRFLSNDFIANINRGDFRTINEIDERLPEIDLESVTIYRLNADSRGYESMSADALAALKAPQGDQNVLLKDGDLIVLDTKSAWKSPRATMTTSVRVLGEVNRPGRYRYTGVRTLRQVVAQAGGGTENAAGWSTVVLRQDDSRATINRQAGVSVLRSVFAHQARQEAASNPTLAAAASAAQPPTLPGMQVLPSANELDRLIGSRTVVYVDSAENSDLPLTPGDVVIVPPRQSTIGCYGAVFRQGELALPQAQVDADEGRRRCGIVAEMSPTVYQFSVRSGSICRDTWFGSCPPLMGGDFIVAVPDAVRKRGVAAFLEFVDTIYRTAVSVAALKVISN